MPGTINNEHINRMREGRLTLKIKNYNTKGNKEFRKADERPNTESEEEEGEDEEQEEEQEEGGGGEEEV